MIMQAKKDLTDPWAHENGDFDERFLEVYVRSCVGDNDAVRYIVNAEKWEYDVPSGYRSVEYAGEYVENARLVNGEHVDPKLAEAMNKVVSAIGYGSPQSLIAELWSSQEPRMLD